MQQTGKEKTAIGYSHTFHNCPTKKTGAIGSIGKGKHSKTQTLNKTRLHKNKINQ